MDAIGPLARGGQLWTHDEDGDTMWGFIGIGLVAGGIVSSWQGFKDPPWEGFSLSKFVRSILVGGALGLGAFVLVSAGVLVVDNRGLLLLTILATEHLVGETYKGFFRRGAHAEYGKLIARLHLPVKHPLMRLLFGVVFLVGGLWLYWWFGRLGDRLLRAFGFTPLAGLLIGGAAGFMAATGGALKDSQFEGFKPRKFVRSPLMAAVGGVALVDLSREPLLISLGSVGFERVVVEFYKTFIMRQVRGIHAGKPVLSPGWLNRRGWFVGSFLAGVIVCGVLLVVR